jgi:hypothetical protein
MWSGPENVRMDVRVLLDEQIDYYRKSAVEYDAAVQRRTSEVSGAI